MGRSSASSLGRCLVTQAMVPGVLRGTLMGPALRTQAHLSSARGSGAQSRSKMAEAPHLHRDLVHPCTHLRRDRAHPCPPTSAPGLGSPLPTSAPGLELAAATSAPRPGAQKTNRHVAHACCMLHVACCMLPVLCCMLHAARCMLHAACCVACCTLQVACCT